MNYNTETQMNPEIIFNNAILDNHDNLEANEAIQELKKEKQTIMDKFPDMKIRMAQAYTQDIIKELKTIGKYDEATLETMRGLIVQFPPQELEKLLSDLIKQNEAA